MSDLLGLLDVSGNPAARFGKWITREIRVVRAVRRGMQSAGYRLDSKLLRQMLYEPGFGALLAEVPREDDALSMSLARVIFPSDRAGVLILRTNLTHAFRIRLSGSTPSTEFQEVANASRHGDVMSGLDAVLGRLDGDTDDEHRFELRLAEMHPLRANELRDLRLEWPGVVRVIGAFAVSADRKALLGRWASHPPVSFQDAPPDLFGVLADIASDLPGMADQRLAEQFIRRALDRQIEPRGYWLYRQLGALQITSLDEAARLLDGVRGYPLAEAALHPDGMGIAIDVLEGWSPGTRREEVVRRLMLVDYYLRGRRIDDAVMLARSTATEFDSTSAALLAIQGMLARFMIDRSPVHRGDASAALLLANEVRANRRRWGLDSGAALAVEIRIRRNLSDYQGALDIANGVGEVPATPEELRHPDAIAESAMVHAVHGDVEIAKRLLSEAPSSRREHIAAVIAEREGREMDAVQHWVAAIESTEEYGEKTDMALQLAFHGVRSPFVDELAIDNPEPANEIGLTAALFGHQPGALEGFRVFANAEHRGAMWLYVYFEQDGDDEAAGSIAREGAARWNDPDLWLESAKLRLRRANFEDAIADARSALVAATDEWGGRRRTYRVLIEALAETGDWQAAGNAAAQLLAEDPGSTSAAWALVTCQIRTSDLTGALSTWRDQGGPDPDGETEVISWITLLAEFGDQVGSPRDALRIAARYPGSEPIRRMLIGALFSSERRPNEVRPERSQNPRLPVEVAAAELVEEPDPDRQAFQTLLGNYLEDFPDGGIRQVSVDLENPLQSLQDLSGDQHRSEELDEAVRNGGLPVGFAAEANGRTYLESLLIRAVGPVFTGTVDIRGEENAIANAHGVGAVVDLSALVTIARLPEELRTQLAGHFANARVVIEHRMDALSGARAISSDSGMTFVPGAGGEMGRLLRSEPEELEARSLLARLVEQSFAQFANDSHASLTAMSPLEDLDFDRPFLLAADHALALQLPFWADDRALKELVRSQGGQVFDTPEVLNHLRGEGVIAPELLDFAEARLIASGYTGLRFRLSVWELAATMASSAGGLVNAIRYGGNEQIGERARFAMGQIDSHISDPTILGAFVHALAQWLINVAHSAEAAAHNVALFAADLLRREWMNSSVLPYCIGAFRAAEGGTDAGSVALREIYRRFETLAADSSDEVAAIFVFELVSRLDPADAFRVRAAVLSRSFE